VNIETEILNIKQTLKRIESNSRPKATWVTASWVIKVTGFNNNEMLQARRENVIEYRRKKSGRYEYKLESIPDVLILKNKAA
jgi:hypothetical protein